MQVELDSTSMYAKINMAINEAAENNTVIKVIKVTEDEMKEFLGSSVFDMKLSPDTHYGQNVIPYPTLISGVDDETKVPKKCRFRGVLIAVAL